MIRAERARRLCLGPIVFLGYQRPLSAKCKTPLNFSAGRIVLRKSLFLFDPATSGSWMHLSKKDETDHIACS